MYLCISGFLPDEDEDDSLKFDLDLDEYFNDRIIQLLGHSSLNAMAVGEWLLTKDQIREISDIIGKPLPTDLDLFIGVLV
ncbi:pyocin S6 family toxin immunity protein [Pseudomonas sp. Z4-20]|uniref:pyocin S6 family toxin immunity protein n=1 Tax=unclassified Pseudomonas TaxID=196821 RepID=UPI003DA849EE